MAIKNALGGKLPVITLWCAGVSLIVHGCPGLQHLLVYDRLAIQAGELWRLGTACLVHFSTSHLLWDLLVFVAAGCVIQVRGYRGYTIVCCLAAVIPSVWLLLISPELTRYGGLSGLATGAVAYLCLCELPRSGRHRSKWLSILAMIALKICVETITRTSLFADDGFVSFQVLPSVHVIGFAVAIAVYGTIQPNKRLDSPLLCSTAQNERSRVII